MTNQQTYQTAFKPNLVHPTAFIGQGAVIVGDVTLSEDVGVWFNATLRADTTPVTIGPRSNIQEGCIFHADPGFPAIVGAGVTVGHGVLIHGAIIGDNTMVGMRAILLNGATVGENCIIAAGTLIPGGKTFPDGVLIMGSPGKIVRAVTAEEIQNNRDTAARYVERARAFRQSQLSLFPPTHNV